MFKTPAYSQNVSLRLSEVLHEIGVNERIVMKRRRVSLLRESMLNITLESLFGINATMYFLGSASEGTTTLGLNSDLDTLYSFDDTNVMQDWSEWKKDMINLLMIQDEATTPGYCFLQQLRSDEPLPLTYCPDDQFISDRRGRIFMKHEGFNAIYLGGVQHGPSCAIPGRQGYSDRDVVLAYPCKSWPRSAAGWFERPGIGRWPTTEMKRYAVRQKCFVVPVCSKVSAYRDLEWRISTSLAERCLMLSLNITQIRCYILMKMVLKTLTIPLRENNLSSFMCKTVLLHCVENTESNTWTENNLLICLTYCLIQLYNCVQNDNCSHVIISENNLMAGQFQAEVKHYILVKLSDFILSDGEALLHIRTDDLGQRLQAKMNGLHPQIVCRRLSSAENVLKNVYLNFYCSICRLHAMFFHLGSTDRLKKHMYTILQNSINASRLEKTACRFLLPVICTTLGTSLASSNIEQNQTVSHEALEWLSAGLNSDVLSSRLKLASVFYSAGYVEKTEVILRHAEMHYKSNTVQPICICWKHETPSVYEEFSRNLDQQNEGNIANKCAYCVKFLQDELNCVPRELQHEMFRSTQEDLHYRDQKINYWMDWAVVDSLPYLYFLQYKTYGQLQRYQDQQQALSTLVKTIEIEPNLWHRETALNLLGQCMEQENKHVEAIRCYILSLNARANNNAAKFHTCRLLVKCVSQT